MHRLTAALGLTLALVAVPGHAAFGDRDCSFGNAGTHNVAGAFGPMLSAAAEADGNILVRMGYASTGSEIYRIGAHGTTSIQIGSGVNIGIHEPTTVLQGDGRIVISTGCGTSDCAGNVFSGGTQPGIARFLASGGLDSSYGAGGYATLSGFTNADSGPIVQPDGRILVGGIRNGARVVVRFNSDGSPDSTFGSGGVAPGGGSSIALQSDGFIVAAVGVALRRHRPDGQLDSTFGSGGLVSLAGLFSDVLVVRVQPGGKIIVLGWYAGTSTLRIARYDTTGALDTTAANGVGYRNVTYNGATVGSPYTNFFPMTMMADGRPVVVGVPASGPTGALVRYGIDLTDDVEAPPLDFAPSAAFALPDGRVIVGGGVSSVNEVRGLLGDADAPTCTTTSTTLSSAPNPSTFNQPVTLTATVTPASAPPAQGSVQFRRGSSNIGTPVTLSNGIATSQTSSLPEGTSTLTAVFSGTGVFLGSTSAPTAHTVTLRPASATTMSSSPNPSGCGEAVTLSATVAPASGGGTPTGTVQFRDGASSLGSPAALSNAVATLTVSGFFTGTHSLTAVYSGDASFGSSTSPAVSHVVPTCITVSDPTVPSGPSPTSISFAVSLTASSASVVQVSYATLDRSAIAGADYTATTGTLTFNPGETLKTVDVAILAKGAPHPDKDFFLVLSNPANAALAKGAGIGTIRYVSTGALSVHIDDPAVTEGNSGVTLIGFTVSLNHSNSSAVSVSYATADGTAFAGSDYTAQSGTLTFAPGQIRLWVVVPVATNVTVQPDRSFFVNLSNATAGAVIAKAQGTGTINDDDPAPPAATIPMYRLYIDITKEHLYTTDSNEYAVLGTRGWVQEGTAWTMFGNGTHAAQYTIPLYRLYHGGIRQHHWTTDANEAKVLAQVGWQYEAIAGYLLPSAAAGSTPLYRLRYNTPPLHLWTTDANEKNVLSTQRGWVYEGIVGEVLP